MDATDVHATRFVIQFYSLKFCTLTANPIVTKAEQIQYTVFQ